MSLKNVLKHDVDESFTIYTIAQFLTPQNYGLWKIEDMLPNVIVLSCR